MRGVGKKFTRMEFNSSGQFTGFTDSHPYIAKAPKNKKFINDINSSEAYVMRHQSYPKTSAQTTVGVVHIGAWHYDETFKSNIRDEYYFLKNEIAKRLDYYLPSFDYDGPEPLDTHNSDKSKAGRRKKHGKQMHKFSKVLFGYTFVVKVLEMKNGELNAWTTYIQ